MYKFIELNLYSQVLADRKVQIQYHLQFYLLVVEYHYPNPNQSNFDYMNISSVGLQKRAGKRFTGFGQTMVRNVGRNGIALSFGFRLALGK